jgi:hypothetical protein
MARSMDTKCKGNLISTEDQFIGFWRKLQVIHWGSNNRGFTRLSITKNTIE